jgi:hypothetical protein
MAHGFILLGRHQGRYTAYPNVSFGSLVDVSRFRDAQRPRGRSGAWLFLFVDVVIDREQHRVAQLMKTCPRKGHNRLRDFLFSIVLVSKLEALFGRSYSSMTNGVSYQSNKLRRANEFSRTRMFLALGKIKPRLDSLH